MRISRPLLTAALALVPLIARAQAPAAPPPASTGWTGAIDFGVRGTSADGDAARYERYRDLGDGLFVETPAPDAGTERMVPGPRRRSPRPPRSALSGRPQPARQVQDLVPVGSDPDAAEPHDPDALHRRRVGRARDRQCPAGAGPGGSRRHRPGLLPVRHRVRDPDAPADCRRRLRVPHRQRADRQREGSPHGPRRHDPVWRLVRPQQPGRAPGPDRPHVDGGGRGRRVRARPAAAARRLHRVLLPQRRHVGRLRQSVPGDRQRVGVVAGTADARAEQLLQRRQRSRVREAAASLPRERLRLGRPAHRRRRSDRAADDQCGAVAGAARAHHGERRGADDGGQSHLRVPADPLRRRHGRLSAIRLRQSDARIRDDAAGLLRQRASPPWIRRSIPNRSACFGTRWMPTSS